eukprot:TRINITY_DN33_c0_g1_i4.p1 TRINITY_DN33_c0_g1~~TRINITY_DN33_c0_g1_i4.p1  ORF type:complete len:487 (-),score=53.12 TRINITY_DN33_c0_g1_i4:551-2011(-)
MTDLLPDGQVEADAEDKGTLDSTLAAVCPIFLSCAVESYKHEGLIALPVEASRCSILAFGPDDDDVFQSVTLKTGYDFSKVSRVFVDHESRHVLTWGAHNVYVVPVILTPSHNEKTRLVFLYVYTVKCSLLRWVLTNSLDQVVTIIPVQALAFNDGPEYRMCTFKCGPHEARIRAKAIIAMSNASQAKCLSGLIDSFDEAALSFSPLHLCDLETFCKNLTTEQWGQCLSWGRELESITRLCHKSAVVLLDEAAEGRQAAQMIGLGLGSTLSKFPLLRALRFTPDQAGCSFELDVPELECPWSVLRCILPDWGSKGRPSLPVERWDMFFDPLPSTWAKYEYALAALLEQRFMALLHKLQEAVAHKHKADAPEEPSVRCVGKRARRTARRSRGGKKTAVVPEKQERSTVQLSEPEGVDADTDFEDLGDASHMTGSCVEEPESRCSWETGSTKGSNCSGLATSDASTEELDSPLSGSRIWEMLRKQRHG